MPIWLLTIGTRLLGLRSVIAKAWGWITGSSTHLLLAALIASNAAWFIGHRIDTHSLGKVRGQLAKCTQGRADDRKAVAAAQAKATEAQKAANLAAEAAYKQKAEETDHAYQTALQGSQRAAERFIAANRVQPRDSGPTGSPAATAQGDGTQGGDRSSTAPELVVVPADDVRICTENTQRLEAVRTWALGL